MTTLTMAILLGQLVSLVSTKKITFFRIARMLMTVIALFILTSAALFMLMLQYFEEQVGA